MMIIDNKFELGQKVYLVTDKEQLTRIVNGIQVCSAGSIIYRVACGTVEFWASDYEISTEKNIEQLVNS